MKGRRKADLQTLDLFATATPITGFTTAPEDGDTITLTTAGLLAALERLADAGLLRRLDSALAAFVAEQDTDAEPALLIATAVLAQMEGRGHSCLPLQALAHNPNE
ncbi:MAG: exodeoxyribonuclease V subunit alpha, partial [Comamonas sp.]